MSMDFATLVNYPIILILMMVGLYFLLILIRKRKVSEDYYF